MRTKIWFPVMFSLLLAGCGSLQDATISSRTEGNGVLGARLAKAIADATPCNRGDHETRSFTRETRVEQYSTGANDRHDAHLVRTCDRPYSFPPSEYYTKKW